MKATFITAIPQVGDIHMNKTLYELLMDVLPANVFCGLGVSEVSFGYLEKFKCNVLTLRLIDKRVPTSSKDLVFGVFYKGEPRPVSVLNASKGREFVFVNWGVYFYNLGMFEVSEDHQPIEKNSGTSK